MTLAEAAEKAGRDAFEKAGSPAVYTSVGSAAPVDTKVFVEKGIRPSPSEEEALVTDLVTAVYVRREDVPASRRGDRIEVGGATYTVDGVLEDTGYVARLKVR